MGSRIASLASHAISFMSGLEKSTTYRGYPSIQVIDCPWLMDAHWWRRTRDLRCDSSREKYTWWTNFLTNSFLTDKLSSFRELCPCLGRAKTSTLLRTTAYTANFLINEYAVIDELHNVPDSFENLIDPLMALLHLMNMRLMILVPKFVFRGWCMLIVKWV